MEFAGGMGRSARVARVASLLAVLLATSPAGSAAADPVVAVVSSELQAYRAAIGGLQESLGFPVQVLSAAAGDPRLPAGVRAVVSFGSRAAHARYPDGVALVYCMAPATRASDLDHPGAIVEIPMLPPPVAVVQLFRDLQPGLRRLAVPWRARTVGRELEDAVEEVRRFGVQMILVQVPDDDAAPDRLRGLPSSVDALWLVPDPLLVNEYTFSLCREFAISKSIPFYAPTAGLVEKGAVAAVAASFEELGRTAAGVAKAALGGEPIPGLVHARVSVVAVNLAAAARAGIAVPDDMLRRAGRVVR
jgi:hypothetical protein